MELKQLSNYRAEGAALSFNRTSMGIETMLRYLLRLCCQYPFNRTSMELKPT